MKDSRPERLSVCYVVPGTDLDRTAGPTRNAIELARAVAKWADVTLAFRRVPSDIAVEGVRLVEIDPSAVRSDRTGDDSATSGIGYFEFGHYLRSLRRFVDARLPECDALLEKTWLLSGYASSLARRRGVPAIPVVNFVPVPGKGHKRGAAAYVRQAAGRLLAGHFLRQAPLIVAETQHLQSAMEATWGIPSDRFRLAGVGVDRGRFRPSDQTQARRCLGVDPAALVLLYVGILDKPHDLGPAIDAFVASPPENAQLHIVGDGPSRDEYERRAAVGHGPGRVFFHGRVPHDDVPRYIAASDLCLAPYDASSFPGGQIGYSILKIREYLSSGRGVVSIPSGAVLELVREGETGFLFPNDVASWTAFLASPPSRDRLRTMGEAAARTELPTWEDVGRAVHDVIREAVAAARTESAPR